MTRDEAVAYWFLGADDALDTAEKLMKANKYHHALFFCHLALEKALKAKVISSSKQVPPPIHDLLRLAEKAKIELSQEQEREFDEINSFNLRARYDEYKFKFRKKANRKYAEKWYQISKNYLLWLTKK